MSKLALCSALFAVVSLLSCHPHGGGSATGGVDPLNVPRSGVDEGNSTGNDFQTNVIPDKNLGSDDLADASPTLKPIFFNYDRYDIREDQRPTLETDAGVLLEKSGPVVIQGHCDERGTEEYNLALGDRRARAVREYLISLGVSGEQLSTISYGEFQPFANGHSEEAWQQNRRAQFAERPR